MNVIRLAGCSPTPLAHYLKALAVLRLVAEQVDPAARGLWKDDAFTLVSALDEAALVDFFLEQYRPTPLVAPWNGGSGFYPKDQKEAFSAITASDAPRFAAYRGAIAAAKRLVEGRTEAPKGREKAALLEACRREWAGPVLDWLDAAVVVTDDEPRYPALLGTGGNDGRLDFTNNQMQRLAALFELATGAPKPEARSLLRAALFGEATRGLADAAIGQFSPGAAGGANQGFGFSGSARVNAWDFVLMLEGALVLQVAAVRRLDSAEPPQAAAPFAFRALASGYGSATPADETTRGEQWMPLWSRAATLAEVRALFAQGRARLGDRSAVTAADAARAIARVGTSRGVDAFVRVAYLERNGQANLAVPIGRFRVSPRARLEIALLDEIHHWVSSLRRATRDAVPASMGRAVRAIESAILDVCQLETDAAPWQRLLTALGDAEALLVARPRATAEERVGPIPPLSRGWLDAAQENSAEWRIAAAIASQDDRWHPRSDAAASKPIDHEVKPSDGTADEPAAAHARKGGDGRRRAIGPFRIHCAPLDPNFHYERFAVDSDALRRDRSVVFAGRDLADDLAAVVLRRIIDARHAARGKNDPTTFPLRGCVFASLDDVAAFVDGETDDAKIAGWIRALAAVKWSEVRGYAPRSAAAKPSSRRPRPSALHALFRLAYPGEVCFEVISVRTENASDEKSSGVQRHPIHLRFRHDAAPIRLLLAGRLAEATRDALQGLAVSGARPKIRFGAGSALLARRLAASIAIPVSNADYATLYELLCKPTDAPPDDDAPPPLLPTPE